MKKSFYKYVIFWAMAAIVAAALGSLSRTADTPHRTQWQIDSTRKFRMLDSLSNL